MLIKIFVVLVMLVILYCLGTGLFYLVKDIGNGERTVKALTWRIGISLGLFLLLFIGYATGIIQPHGIIT